MAADVDAVNLALFVLRVSLGAMMVAHGVNKVNGGIDGTAGWFASMGMRPGRFHAWLAALTEIGAGALMVLGLLTPLAAAAFISLMIVAHVVAHRRNGFFIFNAGQGWEYVAMIGVTAFAVGSIGPGEWSLDDAFGIEWDGWTGMLITATVGIGAAAVLLGAFYRPPAEG